MCLAVPGQLLDMRGADALDRTGRVQFGGAIKEVSLAYVPEVQVGDFVLVHVGFAIAIVDPEEARAVFQFLKQMDELEEFA